MAGNACLAGLGADDFLEPRVVVASHQVNQLVGDPLADRGKTLVQQADRCHLFGTPQMSEPRRGHNSS